MRTASRFLILPIAAVLLAACERHSPTMNAPMPEPLRLSSPDASFRISEAERARIPKDMFDADALERLLAEVRPDMRAEILEHFLLNGRPGHLTAVNDPALQPLLEAVWAPLWRNATDEEIEADIYGLPGRKITKERRETARRNAADPRQGHDNR